jgi:DNA polymerase I
MPNRRRAGGRVTIVSADKDLMQLVGDGVEMVDTLKNRRIGPEEVVEKFGVGPDRVVDVQALAGDSVDNVPGAPGIGIKTAAQLIQDYGDLDTLLARAGEIKQPKRRETLIDNAGQIRLSRELVTLKRDAPVELPLEALEVREPDPEELLGFLARMEFRTLTGRIAQKLGIEPPPVSAPAPGDASAGASNPRAGGAAGPARPASPRPRPSTARSTRPCAPRRNCRPGSTASPNAARSPSTPRPPRSTRCWPSSSASRSPPAPARPATSRSAMSRATATSSARRSAPRARWTATARSRC